MRAVTAKAPHDDEDDDSEEDDNAVETDKVRAWTAIRRGAQHVARRAGQGGFAKELFLELASFGPLARRTPPALPSPARRARCAVHDTRVRQRRLVAVRARLEEGVWLT